MDRNLSKRRFRRHRPIDREESVYLESLGLPNVLSWCYRGPQNKDRAFGGFTLPSRQPAWFETINPATGKTLKRYKSSTKGEVDKAVAKAKKAFEKWHQLPPNKRAIYLERTAKTLPAQKEKLARIITQEMGKPTNESLPALAQSASPSQHYSQNGPTLFDPQITKT